MKSQLFSSEGKKLKEIELPKVFSTKIREDIVKKVFDSERTQHPYGPTPTAGRRHSASGTISHQRHDWKGHYGKGMSRVPRKTMWRRGNQFYWIGAEISSARGGRRAHPPKPVGIVKMRKINKKEYQLALNSAIASTANSELIRRRYERLSEHKIASLPIVIESNSINQKTNKFLNSIQSSLGELNIVVKKDKQVRAGKGKSRNRKYKKSAGVILIIGKDEKFNTKTIDHVKVNEITITDLYPLGRVAIYTEQAIKELENIGVKK